MILLVNAITDCGLILVVIFVGTQIIIPLFCGRPLFPLVKRIVKTIKK